MNATQTPLFEAPTFDAPQRQVLVTELGRILLWAQGPRGTVRLGWTLAEWREFAATVEQAIVASGMADGQK